MGHSIGQQIANKLLEIQAVKININQPYIWASGIKSPIYCDNRVTLSDVNTRELICAGFLQLIDVFGPIDVVAGVATGGIAHGMLLADRIKKPFIYIRSSPKGHGLQNAIEGRLLPDQKVLVIEDLVSTGGSSYKAVEAIRSQGNTVIGMLSIFTYGFESANKLFADGNLSYQALTHYDELINEAIAQEYIPSNALQSLQNWRSNPSTWIP